MAKIEWKKGQTTI